MSDMESAAFLWRARAALSLATPLWGIHPEHKNKPEIVQTQSRRCKTIVVFQR